MKVFYVFILIIIGMCKEFYYVNIEVKFYFFIIVYV